MKTNEEILREFDEKFSVSELIIKNGITLGKELKQFILKIRQEDKEELVKEIEKLEDNYITRISAKELKNQIIQIIKN